MQDRAEERAPSAELASAIRMNHDAAGDWIFPAHHYQQGDMRIQTKDTAFDIQAGEEFFRFSLTAYPDDAPSGQQSE